MRCDDSTRADARFRAMGSTGPSGRKSMGRDAASGLTVGPAWVNSATPRGRQRLGGAELHRPAQRLDRGAIGRGGDRFVSDGADRDQPRGDQAG